MEIIRWINSHKKQTQLGSMLMLVLVMLQGELPLGGSKARGPEIRIHRQKIEKRMNKLDWIEDRENVLLCCLKLGVLFV